MQLSWHSFQKHINRQSAVRGVQGKLSIIPPSSRSVGRCRRIWRYRKISPDQCQNRKNRKSSDCAHNYGERITNIAENTMSYGESANHAHKKILFCANFALKHAIILYYATIPSKNQ